VATENKSKTKATFQKHNFPRLKHTGCSVSQVSLNSTRKLVFGRVFNQFCTAPIFRANFTADETLLHHYEPASKAQSMAWKYPKSPVAKKFKSQPLAGKIMLSLFWDMEGANLVHFISKDETVKSELL
jgi:hypothetical protein